MEKLEIATAGFVSNFQNAISIELATPPPPIPATVQSAIMIPKVKRPATSIDS